MVLFHSCHPAKVVKKSNFRETLQTFGVRCDKIIYLISFGGVLMKDYIKEGLRLHIAPADIYKMISEALESELLTAEEKAELEQQQKKAKSMADLFRF